MKLRNTTLKIILSVFIFSVALCQQVYAETSTTTNSTTTATSTEEISEKNKRNQVLTVISPNGGEQYTQGDKIMYKWSKGKISKKLEATLINTEGEVVYTKKLPNGWGVNKKMISKKETRKIEAGEYILSICDVSKTSTSTSVCDKSDGSFTLLEFGVSSTTATSTATTTKNYKESKNHKTKEICQITKTKSIDGVEVVTTKDVKCNSKEFRKTSKKNKKMITTPVIEAVSTKTGEDTE